MSPKEGYRGGHIAEYMKRPEVSEFRRLQKAAGGNIRLLTLASEWPGSARFISAVAASGVVISLGHTNANNEQIDDAIRAGARMCTHLGNGCLMLVPRHDNVIQRPKQAMLWFNCVFWVQWADRDACDRHIIATALADGLSLFTIGLGGIDRLG